MKIRRDLEEVHFTRREQDVISCLLHGRGLKKTAQLLGISSRAGCYFLPSAWPRP
jgi:DNA-binding CsgD family transcriptional regulator